MLGTWWNKIKHFNEVDTNGYLNFGGFREHEIRPATSEAACLAVSLKLGVYDEKYIGVPREEANKRLALLIASLAQKHLVYTKNGWGNAWQSPLWCGSLASAAWYVWPELPDGTQKMVKKVIEYESDRLINLKVPYYQDRNQKVLVPGDTKAEENAWHSFILQLATAMMPNHPNHSAWMNKNLELLVSTFSRPSDTRSKKMVNGKSLNDWLKGSNCFEDGLLVNHFRIHPEYCASGLFEFSPLRTYPLAKMKVPTAAVFNLESNYRVFYKHIFKTGDSLPDSKVNDGKVMAPGGIIYSKATSVPDDISDIYFPQGNDWGYYGRVNYVAADAVASVASKNRKVRKTAEFWLKIHAQKVLNCQNRFSDGRVYGAAQESVYQTREEAAADQLARAYLVRWLNYQSPIRYTNDKLD